MVYLPVGVTFVTVWNTSRKESRQVDKFLARIAYVFAAAVARTPWSLQRGVANLIGDFLQARNTKIARSTMRNLELAYPQMPDKDENARRILQTTVMQGLETLKFWTTPTQRNLRRIKRVNGEKLFDDAIAAGKGVIVTAPHYGNWELLNQWLAEKTEIAVLYAPPDAKAAEEFLNIVRDNDNHRVTQVRADGASGVRTLLKILKQGGVIGILPDQQPKVGDGEYAPFFDYPALTMTLLSKLAQKTKAPVIMAYCERVDDKDLQFEVHLEAADLEIYNDDLNESVAALNRSVEKIARRDFLQYQWTYKRFTKQVGDKNPYYPDCY